MTRPLRALRAASSSIAARSSIRSAARIPRPSLTIAKTLRPSPIAGPSRLISSSSSKFARGSAHPVLRHGDLVRPKPGTGIKVTYQDSKGNVIKTIEGNEGDDLLSLAHEHDIDLEGACERSVACSTCHVIISPEYYDKLPDPEDDENDMLDLAFGLEDTVPGAPHQGARWDCGKVAVGDEEYVCGWNKGEDSLA